MCKSHIGLDGKNDGQMGKRKVVSALRENKGIDEVERNETKKTEKTERGKVKEKEVSPLVILGPPNDCSMITFRPNARHVSKLTRTR